MATPFATASDLATRLKVPEWTGDALAQVEEHLADASNELRAMIGWQVYPPVAVTITDYPDSLGHLALPGSPVVSVASVADAGGVPVGADRYKLINGAVHLSFWDRVSVTYTVGYPTPPPDLVAWTCVLAAQSLARTALGDGSMGATPANLSVDDFRVGFSAQQQAGESGIPERALERLRTAYGSSVYVT